MWEILENKDVLKQLKKTPAEIKQKYEFWKNVAKVDGPKGLKLLSGLKDHALKGDWSGARSSRLNKHWRVIYSVEKTKFTIFVLEINAHDYRKKT
jgi:addiction module RelE/StbE family toxin